MYKWLFTVILIPSLCCAQHKIKVVYGVALNGCKEEVISATPAVALSNARALGIHFNAGCQVVIDTHFVFYAGLRYGFEKSLFDVIRNGSELSEFYYFTNQNLLLVLAPGLVLNKRQKLFATTGMGHIYLSNAGGSGVRAGRAYTFGNNETDNSFEYRLGLKWQYKLFKEKKMVMEIGTEMSNVQHKGTIVIKNGYNNRPDEYYKVNYSVLIFYLGLMF